MAILPNFLPSMGYQYFLSYGAPRAELRYKLLIFFMISVIFIKTPGKYSDFHITYFQIEGPQQDFPVVPNLIEILKSLYGVGGRSLKIRDVCMDF